MRATTDKAVVAEGFLYDPKTRDWTERVDMDQIFYVLCLDTATDRSAYRDQAGHTPVFRSLATAQMRWREVNKGRKKAERYHVTIARKDTLDRLAQLGYKTVMV